MLNVKSIEIRFNILDHRSFDQKHATRPASLSFTLAVLDLNKFSKMAKKSIKLANSWRWLLWWLVICRVVFLSTRHKHPSWHRGESVRFLFLNPLPLLLGIQELPVPNKFLLIPPIFFWAIYSQNLRKFLSSKCSIFLQGRVLLEFSSAFPPAPSVSSVIFHSVSQRWESNFCRNSSNTLKDWHGIRGDHQAGKIYQNLDGSLPAINGVKKPYVLTTGLING